jgi:hypothetical protein
MNDAQRPEWLTDHLDRLPAELEPGRDLWPGIAARLDRGRPSRWQVPALAASLVLCAGLALFGWQAFRAAQAERLATQALIAELLAPYDHVRQEQAVRWQAVRATLHPSAADALQEEMETLTAARASLTDALARAPADPALHRLLRQVVTREAELIDAGTHLGPHPI